MKEKSLGQYYEESPEFLIEDLMSIIDTKIQYMDFQTQMATSSFVDINNLSLNDNAHSLGNGLKVLESIIANNGRVIEKIQEYSGTIKLLLHLKTQLSPDNAISIFELLTDNQFTQLTEVELNAFLKKSVAEIEEEIR